MIELINDKLIEVDDMGNMTVYEDESLTTLIDNMKLVIDDIVIDEKLIEPVEDIYYYLIEKIYTMPDYPKWNDVPFRDKPKAKLLIALNKFIHDKTNRRTE
ncbi:MAG: hypothetical protein CMP84_12735 [Gammaproteobacteria bacterium]|jgi:hypothetical protein|nr:hypothetical protein [Gammaproteobacteria bacterium]BAR36071.1 hypothetical protein [uncultured Mediterranean phage uvMED]|tara:strand:+ start:90 stop:392 length:303 start_codon:yes stop_codon:yes gene_type:complete